MSHSHAHSDHGHSSPDAAGHSHDSAGHSHDSAGHSHDSAGHSHDSAGHSHDSAGTHGHGGALEEGPGPAPLAVSQRYEMEDLFRGEAPENQHFLKILGLVVLVVFLGISLAYPFLFLGK